MTMLILDLTPHFGLPALAWLASAMVLGSEALEELADRKRARSRAGSDRSPASRGKE